MNPVRTLVRLSRYLFFQNYTSIFFKMGSRFDQRKRHKKSNFKVKWYLFYQNDTFFTKMIPFLPKKGPSFFLIIRRFLKKVPFLLKKVPFWNKKVSFFLKFWKRYRYEAHFEKTYLFGDVFKLVIIRRFLKKVPFLLKKVPFWNKKVPFLSFEKGTFFFLKHVLKSWRDSLYIYIYIPLISC